MGNKFRDLEMHKELLKYRTLKRKLMKTSIVTGYQVVFNIFESKHALNSFLVKRGLKSLSSKLPNEWTR